MDMLDMVAKNSSENGVRLSEKTLLNRLRRLHDVGNDLNRVDDTDELFRLAVIFGRDRLDFDRLGFFLLNRETMEISGTFGTDEQGGLRDERDTRLSIHSGSSVYRLLEKNLPFITNESATLLNQRGEKVGAGMKSIAALWNGQSIIGFLAMDNLLRQEAVTQEDCELLSLYAKTVAHHYSRLAAEKALRDKENDLRHVQKAEAIGRLAGGIAHDFNNMLTTILGFAWMLKKELGGEHFLCGDVEEIIHAGERAATLTRRLLTFARKDDAVARRIDVNQAVTDLNRLLVRLLGRDVELITMLGHDVGSVLLDPTHLDQVIINLAVNAHDAMSQGGKLYIRTAKVHLDHVKEGCHPGDYILLSVKDTGSGIPDEIKDHIFDPFFTTKEAGKGTGLGLSIVDSIVNQSGGFVELMSSPGMGAEFQLYFPRHDPASQEDGKNVMYYYDLPQGEETVLVVEDDDSVRRYITRTLGSMGYTVFKAHHGEEALRMLDAGIGPVDVVLTDIMMPHMGGFELAQEIDKRSLVSKILFTSGDLDQTQFRREFGDQTRYQLIMKPFSQMDMILKIRELLNQPLLPVM